MSTAVGGPDPGAPNAVGDGVATEETRGKFPKKLPVGECAASGGNAGVAEDVPCTDAHVGSPGTADLFCGSREPGELCGLAGLIVPLGLIGDGKAGTSEAGTCAKSCCAAFVASRYGTGRAALVRGDPNGARPLAMPSA